jgi:hypothetical protein
MPRQTRLAEPARLCRDTTWAQLVESTPPSGITSSGEAWEMTGQPPAPDGPASVVCRLLATNVSPCQFTTAFSGDRKAYEIREGSLWERDCPLGTLNLLTVGSWQRVGRRSDWVSLHAAGPTVVGLTAEGTLWMWGYDPSQVPRANLAGTLSIIQTRLSAMFSGTPVAFGPARTPFYQKNPRPILRMAQSQVR